MKPTPILVASDVVLFTQTFPIEVLLIRRKNPPFQYDWALPGGFLEPEEDLMDGALRELREETNISLKSAVQIGAFGKPNRDPRGRVISIAFAAKTNKNLQQPKAADDAKELAWHPINNLPEIAFDHLKIIEEAQKALW